ncbi:MAG TPA: iron chelate uptake ABC transporter family permease subunit [Phycisphaerae bacterium]|nr:iron chelate uptake ABC transporter family permease subunit [Phycisphaerae bacterium]
MTAGVVAQCGPIGFVGLLIPHIMRLLVGPTHRLLLPACMLGGAIFLPLCDAVARTGFLVGSARQLPVGVLTNLIGGAFFLYLLLRRREERPIL